MNKDLLDNKNDEFSSNNIEKKSDNIAIRNAENKLPNGQIKCPKCGSTDIMTNTKTGKLRCLFCRYEFEIEFAEKDRDITTLEGTTILGGAKDIEKDSKDHITLKCESCGAEVVIDTSSSTQARCHWCRNTLSINTQIPNGLVPDVVLPFKISKEEAEIEIKNFVNKRKFFAHPQFKKEFSSKNILGVYFPYMIVDANCHMHLKGEGEIETARRTVKSGKKTKTVYDADVYKVVRDFDIMVDDLSIEASTDNLDYNSHEKTTNIINSIMPFDTENCVKYNANYLRGFTSEKRDINISRLKKVTDVQNSDIARMAARETIIEYDRGVRWDFEKFDIKGDSWKAAYLPVWIYSYMEKKRNKNLIHYVLVNARTKETMGSVPINTKKLILFSMIIEIFVAILAQLLNIVSDTDTDYLKLLLLIGVAFYAFIYLRYRNLNARHSYENETKFTILNLKNSDEYVEHLRNLSNKKIYGENSSVLKGNKVRLKKNKTIKKATDKDVDNGKNDLQK